MRRDAQHYDYIVIGAGSAGCVLANRLGADPTVRVLLLEAGPADQSWRIDMPAAMGSVVGGTRFNWSYLTDPEPGLDQRRIATPRGKVLGGSSSINGMVYIRGHARDYDGWAAAGCAGWSYHEVLPYFIRSECHSLGADLYHGVDGHLHVTAGDTSGTLESAFIEAGSQAGYGTTADCNGYRQEGFGRVDRTTRHGCRWSTARGYLAEALTRGNVTVLTGSTVHRVIVAGARATGVAYERAGHLTQVIAQREVILSAGAINTPQLLLLSGIGPAQELQALGIEPVVDLPGVGRRLADHPDIVVQCLCREPVSIYPQTRAPRNWLAALQWFVTKSGLFASNQFEAGAFIRSRAGVPHPDLQLTLMPLAVRPGTVKPIAAHAFQVHIDLMRPKSLGSVTLASRDPSVAPRFVFNYLTEPEDRADLRGSVHLVRELLSQPAMTRYAGPELSPGPPALDDAALDAWLRATTETGYHASGSCKMGPSEDPEAVVSADLKVHGVECLRVIDASVTPSIVSGNTNSPVVMIAEKGSDLVLGKPPLPASDAPVWEPAEWPSRQRSA
jgi:choline dehydrogenase